MTKLRNEFFPHNSCLFHMVLWRFPSGEPGVWDRRRDCPLYEFALLKRPGMQQFPWIVRHSDRADIGEDSAASSGHFDHEKRNPAQRLRHELRGASIAGAMDPSARPHVRI